MVADILLRLNYCFLAVGLLAFLPQWSFSEAHSLSLSGRARLAHIDADNDGRAASLLVRGTWQAEWFDNLNTMFELDHVSSTWKRHHNNGVDRNAEPFVPDVDGTEINQAYLQFALSNFDFYVGRRRIELDDQRFIGSNGFWQNDQTFDSASVDYSFLSASKLQYSFISNVNRILGNNTSFQFTPGEPGYGSGDNTRPAAQLGDHEHRSHLLRGQLREWDAHALTGFYYHIDNRDDLPTSNRTLGLRYTLDQRIGVLKPSVEASVATQKRQELERADDQYYLLLDLALAYRSAQFGVRYEKLSGKNGVAFITPLGSLHDFHGWADKFNQSQLGIIDRSVHASYRQSPWRFDTRYHWFKTDERAIDWGNELDIDIMYKFNRNHKILLRLADFRSASQSRVRFPSERRVYLNYSFLFE